MQREVKEEGCVLGLVIAFALNKVEGEFSNIFCDTECIGASAKSCLKATNLSAFISSQSDNVFVATLLKNSNKTPSSLE